MNQDNTVVKIDLDLTDYFYGYASKPKKMIVTESMPAHILKENHKVREIDSPYFGMRNKNKVKMEPAARLSSLAWNAAKVMGMDLNTMDGLREFLKRYPQYSITKRI